MGKSLRALLSDGQCQPPGIAPTDGAEVLTDDARTESEIENNLVRRSAIEPRLLDFDTSFELGFLVGVDLVFIFAHDFFS